MKNDGQFKQTSFVLDLLKNKKDGFFIEFGAYDGIQGSNTLELEQMGWNGILGECDPRVIDLLKSNRPKSKIETSLIWSKSNESVIFHSIDGGKLSTVHNVYEKGAHPKVYMRNSIEYNINTISLNDLLIKHNAPKKIDFVSVDVEGAEYEILHAFDFSYEVDVWCIEHWMDFEKIKSLMESKGYIHQYNYESWWSKMDRYIESYFLLNKKEK